MTVIENSTDDQQGIVSEAQIAFRGYAPPPWANNCVTVSDFEKSFGSEFFYDLWEIMYNLEYEEIKFFIPLMIEFYLENYGKIQSIDWRLESWLYFFENFNNKVAYIQNRYESIYEGFDLSQRSCICNFLRFVKKNNLGDTLNMDDSIKFWC